MSLNNSWSKSKSWEINVSSCSHLELHLVAGHSQVYHFNSLGVHALVGKSVPKKALPKPLVRQLSSDCLAVLYVLHLGGCKMAAGTLALLFIFQEEFRGRGMGKNTSS